MKIHVNKDGSKELWPKNGEEIRAMLSLCTKSSTIVLHFMQDTVSDRCYFQVEESIEYPPARNETI